MTFTEEALTTAGPVTGWSGAPDYFAIREYSGFDPHAVVDVLRGRIAGAMFRGMVDPETCGTLAERFWASPHRRTRGVEAPGHFLGAYHYHKTTRTYLQESAEAAEAVDAVLDVPGDPIKRFHQGLADVLAPDGVHVRLAQHDGAQACRGLLRSWHGHGEYALAPHDDRSQCTEPQQADFEIQRVVDHNVVALNICLENGNGGRLAYWNVQPDDASKLRLGLHHTGSPYPLESLDGVEMEWLEVNAGDVYVFNGAHVHAVEPNTDPELRRTTLAAIFGFIDDSTVVSWT
ncbi:hypothetical protein [Amycolatopsis jiangsuensis]|uniref:Fe2OG dioxygenase domain-containing protein n=1 Tax=Amycolatopsis jiangsuensis TaxID=1181879 RepID=A0A840ISS6_9PSEU|nr:hypothetical protein [Amycolatopsis jiangsuensis]MBB4684427.1 hypothetical protein [Amycolatopsis jiangsuensis]